MTDLRSELAWLVEKFIHYNDLVESEWGGSAAEYERDEDRATAILKLTDWQPIETAPKDGTVILIWADGRPHIAEWDRDYDDPDTFSWVTNEEAGSGGAVCYSSLRNPKKATHWKPIDPPA